MTAISLLLVHAIALGNIALLYLVPVMFAAARYGLRAGLFAGLASSLAYNFFFLPPTGTLTVDNPANIISLLVLLGVAIVTSQFAASARAQAQRAQESARQNAMLAGFSRHLSAAAGQEELMQSVCTEIARLLDVRAILLTPSVEGPILRAAVPPEDRIDRIEAAAAQWAMDHLQPAGRGSITLTASDWLFHPLHTQRGVVAVVGMARDDGDLPIPTGHDALVTSLLDQAAVALDRMALEDQMLEARQVAERDRLRAALLSSVSHDLRTPLTSILTAAQALRQEQGSTLVDTIESEAQRLNRFVANLLDMARLEAGALPMRVEATDLLDAVSAAIADTRQALAGHMVTVDLSPDLPLVRVDPVLLHHCLINLLDNAGRYGAPGTTVIIRGRSEADAILLSVIDQGPGIPAGQEARLFETFTRLAGSDRAVHGTGLGLTIVKGFAEAMGLSVAASNVADPSGACFTIRIPDTVMIGNMTLKDLA
ncbi:DUF4118 domain-containing protein [Sphingobium sp. CAP-1]|nr:DUF4118 domain-containing protein [Sphingobium sp. CAP-1]